LIRPKVIQWWTSDRRCERSELTKSKWDDDRRQSTSKLMKEIKKKPVVCDGIEYNSIHDACEKLNLSRYLIGKNIKDIEINNWYII
jgi:hypothetical protein